MEVKEFSSDKQANIDWTPLFACIDNDNADDISDKKSQEPTPTSLKLF